MAESSSAATTANSSGFNVGQRVQATSGSKEGLKGRHCLCLPTRNDLLHLTTGTILSRVGTRWLVDFEDQCSPRK